MPVVEVSVSGSDDWLAADLIDRNFLRTGRTSCG